GGPASGQGSAPRLVSELAASADVDDGADRVRRVDARHDLRPPVEAALEVVQVEAKILGHVDPADLEPAVGSELEPRGDAAVVVEPRDENAVALVPVPRRGA